MTGDKVHRRAGPERIRAGVEAAARRHAGQLARTWRWQRMLDEGLHTSVSEIGDAEDISKSYVCRLLPLTCLAPDIVEAILDGRQPKGLRLAEMLGNRPLGREEQRVNWCLGSSQI